jgi:large subunit ribosomal protein L21
MKYAVIRTGGKQYKVQEGDTISVERVATPVNEVITFSDVLLYGLDDSVEFGAPILTGVSVTGKVVENKRGKKIRVAKFKAKARYRRVMGHRQELSDIVISSIEPVGAATKTATKKRTVTKEE